MSQFQKSTIFVDASSIVANVDSWKAKDKAIQKQNSKTKNRDKVRFISSIRMPFEGVFSKLSKRTRYRTKVKVYFQAVMQAIVSNIKRLLVLEIEEPIPII